VTTILISILFIYRLPSFILSIIYYLLSRQHSQNIPIIKMSAPFIPPPIDASLAPLPIPSLLSSTSTPAEPAPVAHTIPAAPGEPRPVAPAEQIGVPPARALDPVAGEPGLLDKAREAALPVSLFLSSDHWIDLGLGKVYSG
jgi:hypothetical protein